MDENEIASKSSKCHKNYIKQRIREAAFEYLQEKQQNHSKIKEILQGDPRELTKTMLLLQGLESNQ